MPGTFGETNTGGVTPRLASSVATCATSACAIVTDAIVLPAATGACQPSTFTSASSAGTQLSIVTSATAANFLPFAEVTATTLNPRERDSLATSMPTAFEPPCEKTTMTSPLRIGSFSNKTFA